MQKFSKLILSKGNDKISIDPMIHGYKITEQNLVYYPRQGILPQTVETIFDDYSDMENYVDKKAQEGYNVLVTL